MENATVESFQDHEDAINAIAQEEIADINARVASSFIYPNWDGLKGQLETMIHDEYTAQVTAETNLTKGQFIALIVDMIKSGEFVRIIRSEVTVNKPTQAITYQPLVELLKVRAERDALAKQLNDIKAVFSVMN